MNFNRKVFGAQWLQKLCNVWCIKKFPKNSVQKHYQILNADVSTITHRVSFHKKNII